MLFVCLYVSGSIWMNFLTQFVGRKSCRKLGMGPSIIHTAPYSLLIRTRNQAPTNSDHVRIFRQISQSLHSKYPKRWWHHLWKTLCSFVEAWSQEYKSDIFSPFWLNVFYLYSVICNLSIYSYVAVNNCGKKFWFWNIRTVLFQYCFRLIFFT